MEAPTLRLGFPCTLVSSLDMSRVQSEYVGGSVNPQDREFFSNRRFGFVSRDGTYAILGGTMHIDLKTARLRRIFVEELNGETNLVLNGKRKSGFRYANPGVIHGQDPQMRWYYTAFDTTYRARINQPGETLTKHRLVYLMGSNQLAVIRRQKEDQFAIVTESSLDLRQQTSRVVVNPPTNFDLVDGSFVESQYAIKGYRNTLYMPEFSISLSNDSTSPKPMPTPVGKEWPIVHYTGFLPNGSLVRTLLTIRRLKPHESLHPVMDYRFYNSLSGYNAETWQLSPQSNTWKKLGNYVIYAMSADGRYILAGTGSFNDPVELFDSKFR